LALPIVDEAHGCGDNHAEAHTIVRAEHEPLVCETIVDELPAFLRQEATTRAAKGETCPRAEMPTMVGSWPTVQFSR
jgi:hypothetical protein